MKSRTGDQEDGRVSSNGTDEIRGNETRAVRIVQAANASLGAETTLGPTTSADLRALADAAAIATARPRLVICNEAIRRIDRIGTAVWTIGRDDDVDCALDHPAVSSRHARIVFDGRRFHVEDLGSTNHTFIDGEMVPAESSHELSDGDVLRFGAIEALFVTDCDSEGRPIPEGERIAALDLLQAQGKLSGAIRDRAERQAAELGWTTGEALLLDGAIGIDTWTRGLARGEMYRMIRREAALKSRRYAWTILVQAVIIAVLLALLISGTDALGALNPFGADR